MAAKVHVLGVGMVPFQKPGKSDDYPEMSRKAMEAALADAGVSFTEVEQAYVGGNGQAQPYGVLMLSEDGRAKLSNGGRDDLEESLAAHLAAVNAELDHHEHLKFVAVASDDWTIENGLLTPTMKLKRAAIEDMYQPKEEDWYGTGAKVVFG